MDLCDGQHHRFWHVPIVHNEGWAHCPLCRALKACEDLNDLLEEAHADIASWQGRVSDTESELARARRDAAGE
jgi:hypothetical protein